jgi:outer membrane protein TolC
VVGERESSGAWGFGPEAGVSLPIFDQGRGRAAAASAQLELIARLHQAQAVELRSQVRVARARVRAAHARARFLRQVLLPLRTRVVEEAMLRYNGMLAGPFQALDAKRQEIEAGARYIEAMERFWLARTTLDQALQGRATTAGPSAPPRLETAEEQRHD